MPTKKTLAAAAMTAAIAGGSLLGATLGTPFASGAQDATETTTTEATAPDADHAEGRGPRGGFDLSVAAETLGLSEDDLKAQLEEGTTLAEVAEAQGVDKQVLIDALVAEAEAHLDEMKAELPDRIAEMVENGLPAGGPGGPGGHRGPGGPGGPEGRGPGLDAAAEALGVTADDLRTALEEGKTIAQVAEEQGVDVQTVIDAMVADLEAHLAEEVASGEHTQEEADAKLADATERITDMVNNGRPERPQGN